MGPSGDAPAAPTTITTMTHSIGRAPARVQIPRAASRDQRPVGKEGRRIMVQANHFPMEVKIASVVRYDVAVTQWML